MVDDFVFDGSSLPADVHRYMKMYVSNGVLGGKPVLDLMAEQASGVGELPQTPSSPLLTSQR